MAAGKKEPEEKSPDIPGIEHSLRAAAEEHLARSPKISPDLSGKTPEQLIHELEVHQIELETQGEELRKAHLALTESRDKYLDLYEFAPLGYLTLNDRGLITEVNLTGAALLGAERSELVNHGFGRFITPGDLDQWDQYFMHVRNQREKQICTLMLKRGDGSMFPARLEGVRTSGSDGTTTVRIAFSDIADIWQIETLKESESFNRGLVENLPDYIVVYGPDGKILYVNPATVRALGYTMEELAGKSILPYIAPECRSEVTANIAARLEGYDPPEYEMVLIAKDGQRRTVIAKGTRVHYHGGPATLLLLIDITDRKTAEKALRVSEEKFRLLTEKSVFGIIIIQDANIVYANQSFATQLGYPPEEIVGIMSLIDLIHPEDLQVVMKRFSERLEGKIEKGNMVYKAIRKDGSIIDLEVYGVLIDYQGRPGVMVTIKDITGRKREEEALRVNESRLQMAQEIGQIGCWEYDIKTNLMWGSEEGCHLFGYPRIAGSFPIENFTSCIVEPELVLKAFNDLINEGKEYDLEFIINPKDGSTQRTLHSIGILEKDESGNPVKVKGTNQDITERKRVEEESRERAEKYSTIYDQSPIAIELYDASGVLLNVNPACLDLFGVENIQVIQNFSLFTDPNITDEQKKRLHQGEIVQYQGSFDFEKVKAKKLYPTRRDGVIWLDVLITPLVNREASITGFLVQIQDITERKQAEEALRESEDRYRAVADFTYDWEYWMALDGKFVYISPSCERITGYRPEEFTLNPNLLVDITHADDRDNIIEHLAVGHKLNTEHGSLEFRIITRNGEERWIGHECQPVYNTSGGYLGRRGSNRDITERKVAEEAQRESEKKYRSLFEHMLNGIAYCRMLFNDQGHPVDFVYLDVNSAFEQLTGLKNVAGKRVSTVIPEIRESTPDLFAIYGRVALTGKSETFEIYFKPLNLWLHISVYSPGKGDFVAVFENITERKLTEEALNASEMKFRGIFDTINDGLHIHEIDPDGKPGKFIEVNDVACRMLQYTREELLKHGPLDFVTDYHNRPLNEITGELTSTGHSIFETEHRRKDGAIIPVEINSHVVRLQGKRVVVGVVRDITERKELEEEMEYHAQELHQYSTSLAAANKKLNLLSSITRHDINNQLTILMGYLKILENKQPDPTLNEHFQRVSNAAKRISAMVKFTGEYEQIGVNAPTWQECHTLVDTAAKQAPLGMVVVKNDLPAGAEMFADSLVVKVFYNLMDNAVRYGGKITTIRFSVEEAGDDQVIVCEDDGNGIPADEKERIFERGFGKNTGLGLALSQEILSITGIAITETGEPGKGARFEMMVPKGAYRVGK